MNVRERLIVEGYNRITRARRIYHTRVVSWVRYTIIMLSVLVTIPLTNLFGTGEFMGTSFMIWFVGGVYLAFLVVAVVAVIHGIYHEPPWELLKALRKLTTVRVTLDKTVEHLLILNNDKPIVTQVPLVPARYLPTIEDEFSPRHVEVTFLHQDSQEIGFAIPQSPGIKIRINLIAKDDATPSILYQLFGDEGVESVWESVQTIIQGKLDQAFPEGKTPNGLTWQFDVLSGILGDGSLFPNDFSYQVGLEIVGTSIST